MNLSARNLRFIGIIGIIAAVVLVVVGTSMYQSGVETAWLESMSKGKTMMNTGNILKFGGYGVGAVGVAGLVAGFTRKD